MRIRSLRVMLALTALAGPAAVKAQEPRLAGRLPDRARIQVDSVLDAARAEGLPTEPLVDRALEGAVKRASPELIVAAVRRLKEEFELARAAFGAAASPAELGAGASALRAGATPGDLARLRALRTGRSVTVAAAVLADLVGAGVPADTAVTAVLALARRAGDDEYIAFRRNVQRDIALGALPAAALGVRLHAVESGVEITAPPVGSGTGTEAPRKRKP